MMILPSALRWSMYRLSAPQMQSMHQQDAASAAGDDGDSWGCQREIYQHPQPHALHLVHWLPVLFYFLFAPSFSDAPGTLMLLGNFRHNWELLGMNMRTGEIDGSAWLHLPALQDWCCKTRCKQKISLENPEQRGSHQTELMVQLSSVMPRGPSRQLEVPSKARGWWCLKLNLIWCFQNGNWKGKRGQSSVAHDEWGAITSLTQIE